MGGDKAREPDGALLQCRASLAIAQMKTRRMSSSEQRAAQGHHMVSCASSQINAVEQLRVATVRAG